MSGAAHHVIHLPLEGLTVAWQHVASGRTETLSLTFENESWTINSQISGPDPRSDFQYVMRLSATWQLQQMLLFRDLEEPDLWLANDGRGKWGEVNGAQIRELGGCSDIDVRGSSFSRAMAVRRLRLDIGAATHVDSVVVDPETLGVTRSRLLYTRTGLRQWSVGRDDQHDDHDFEVDDYGLPLAFAGHFARVGRTPNRSSNE